jgi:hypothetical protein
MLLKSCLDATHQLEPEAVDDEELRLSSGTMAHVLGFPG